MRYTLFLMAVAAAAAPVDFLTQVRPVLEQHCTGCHGAERGVAGLRLHLRSFAAKALKPGDAAKSPLWLTMDRKPGDTLAMPPGGPQVPAAERAVIQRWINEGAAWPEGVEIGRSSTGKAKDDIELVKKIAASFKPASADFAPYTELVPGSVAKFDMVPVPAGSFTMGTAETEKGRSADEGPQRNLTVAPFWMGKYEVTWDEYRLFMFQNLANEKLGVDGKVDAISRPTKPYVEMSFGMGINGFPAISMTQHAANKYAQWLSAKTGHFYRLPTEAEWEYACRLGETESTDIGWYADNANGKYQPAGQKRPNKLGIYDLLGNVSEWTLDQYDPQAYAKPLPEGGYVPSKTPYPHVARGGGWTDDASRLRCGARLGSDNSWKMQDPQLPKSIWYLTDAQFLGFRLVRPVKTPSILEMFRYWNNGVERE